MKSPSELGVSLSRLKNIYESHILLLYIIAGQVATSFKACGQGVARSTSLHHFFSHFFTPVQIAHIYALLSIRLHTPSCVRVFRGIGQGASGGASERASGRASGADSGREFVVAAFWGDADAWEAAVERVRWGTS